MMQFEYLNISNFRSFKNDKFFTFPGFLDDSDGSGVYFVFGENTVDDALEGNGSGKSTLFDALYWCLYGRTTRGLRGKDIQNWDNPEKKTKIRLGVLINNIKYEIIRSANPNSLKLSIKDKKPHIISQADLNNLIGFTPSEFQNTVLLPQFGNTLLDMSPRERAELFSSLLDLTEWEDAKRRARAHYSNSLTEADNLRDIINRLDGQVSTITQVIERHRGSIKVLTVTIKRLKKEIEDKEKTSTKPLKEKISRLDNFHARLTNMNNKVGANVLDVDKEVDTLNKQRMAIESKLSVAKFEHNDRRKRLDMLLATTVGSLCPRCNVKLSKEHLTAEVVRTKKEHRKKEKELRNLESESRLFEVKISLLLRRRENLEEIRKRLITKKDNVFYKLTISKRRVSELEMASATDLGKLDNLKEQLADVTLMEKDERKKYKKWKVKLAKIKEDHAKLMQNSEYGEKWVNYFEAIRLSLIEESLESFQARTNDYLTELGMGRYTVWYVTERQGRSSDKTILGFNVIVSSDDSGDSVPLAAWSGGEGQRIKLAASLALIDVICARRGHYTDIEVWDEPSTHLSEAGLHAFLELLRSRSKAMGKKIFFIDHSSIISPVFDGYYRIFKDIDGSNIFGEAS